MSAPTTARVTGLSSLSLQLTRARFAARQGESVLYLASIIAYVIGSALALMVAGGTWMFWNRWQHPTGLLADVVAAEPTYSTLLAVYFSLAVLACALLIPTMVGLSSSAAVLGARGREKRLAALRLLGLSSGDVTRMSLIDTLIQAGIGSIVGLVVYFATLPAWHLMSFQATPIEAAEMTLPWWLLVAVVAAIILIGLASSWWGLRQVRISPLGVARLGSRPGLRVWRVVIGAVILVGAYAAVLAAPASSGLLGILVLATVILGVVLAINIAGPWILQLISRLLTRSGSPSMLWAARRVAAAPKQTWQRVSGIGLLALIGGFIAQMPISVGASDASDDVIATLVNGSRFDYTAGALLTIAFGLVLTAASILITQASAVLERAEQSRALTKMGAPRSYLSRVSWLETLGPLVVSMLAGTLAGLALAHPLVTSAASAGYATDGTGLIVLVAVLVAGVGLAVAAIAASAPLQRQVLAEQTRAAD